jgi:hypothetical protein
MPAVEDRGTRAGTAVGGYGERIAEGLMLVCLLALVAAVTVRPRSAMDEDLWWHLRTGEWIAAHGAVPSQDYFGAHTAGHPWVAYTWLFDVFITGVYRSGGLHGVLAVTTVSMLAAILALAGLLARYGNYRRAILLAGMAFVAMVPLVSPRPWLFSILFLIAELYFLLTARESGKAMWMAPVVPLFALWANVHIQFVYGLAVLGVFALEPTVEGLCREKGSYHPRLRSAWIGLLGLSAAATLLNPYGWRLWSVVAQYAFERAPLAAVNEMQAMRFRDMSNWAALALACGAWFALGRAPKRRGVMLLLLAMACWTGFRSARDVWFLAVLASVALTPCAEAGGRAVPGRWVRLGVALPLGAGLAVAVLGSAGVSERALRQAMSERFPEGASRYAEAQGLSGPLYNSYSWGGYLMWRLRGMPVSIDGRANLQGDERVAREQATWSGARTWAEDQELLGASTVILERDCPLAAILRSDGRFRKVYEDGVGCVFERAEGDEDGRSKQTREAANEEARQR